MFGELMAVWPFCKMSSGLFVIGIAVDDSKRSVELFEEYDAREVVG
jgi:hypothetical protein